MERFENGSKYFNNGVAVVDLNGSWYEMGRQYGALLSAEIKDIYENQFLARIIGSGVDKEAAKTIAEHLYSKYPFRFKQLIKGIVETCGLTLEEFLYVNAVQHVAFANGVKPGCTGIAVWSDYAASELVYGRNYDWTPGAKDFAKDVVFTAFHPADGTLATVTVGYAGEIYATTGMNEKGIFLELNNGEPSGGPLVFENRVPAVIKLFEFLLDSATLDDIEVNFQTTKASFAYLIGVTDGQIARCYEWPTFGVKRRETHTRPGLTVITNHFTENSWGLPLPSDDNFWKTRTRRSNLLALAKHFKGAIDNKVMRDMLDTDIENLGAKMDKTIYQIVAEPRKFLLWFKVPGVSEWTEFDLKPLLRPRED